MKQCTTLHNSVYQQGGYSISLNKTNSNPCLSADPRLGKLLYAAVYSLLF